MFKQKILSLILIAAVFMPGVAGAAQAIDPAFNPNQIVPDTVFSDTQTFGGAEGIQKFLESKNSVLAKTDQSFLSMLKEPDATMLKQGLDDPEPALNYTRTAAQLIWDASVQSGLNPQVILVTINKEQGLISSSDNLSGDSLQTALNHAMGFGCPDSGCSSVFSGFYYQLFGNFDASNNRYIGAAQSLMKSFKTPGGRGPLINGAVAHVGDTITLDNTLGGYDGVQPQQSITLANAASAALYRFTPHVFNGNYNFWKYFQSWFKYPNGTLLSLANDPKIYIVQNGSVLSVPSFVAQQRNLNLANKITVSPNEFSGYPMGGVYGPPDNTIVKTSDGKTFVFVSNIEHPASAFVISQRGLNAANALSMSDADAALFQQGSMLAPSDGTVLRGQSDQTVYLVSNGNLQQFSAYTFTQRKIKAKEVAFVPDAEISTYPKKGFVPPLDGSLIKSQDDNTTYLVEKGLRRAVIADIFKNLNLNQKNVKVISVEEFSALPIGAYAEPKDKTFFAVDTKTGPLYEFKGGTKHPISAFVAKQRGVRPDYVFTDAVAVEWFDGIPVAPKDNTILKGDKDNAVYVVINGQLSPLTFAEFTKRKIKPKQISVLSQTEIDSYAKTNSVNQ